MSVAKFWCEQAWLGGEDVAVGVVLSVTGDRIVGVDRGVAAPPHGSTRLDGLTLPGFANAHSHAFHRALRGRTHSSGGTFWTWREQMYELAGALDPETYEALATATFAEMVLAGYTCVGEFHYLHHGPGGAGYDDPNEIGRRLVRAAALAGIRLTLLDTCYLDGGIGTGLSPVQTRFSDITADRWIDRVTELGDTATCRRGAAIHSVRVVDPEAVRVVAAWAADRDLVLHAHVSEQRQEDADCIAAHGCSATELLHRNGALTPSFTAVHATHVAAGDIERLSETSARCCICPTTERELADGIGPTAALRAAAVDLCIGSDSQAVIDPFEETRAIELDERLVSMRRGTHSPPTLLAAATANGYRSLGWPEGGVLAVGALADFVTVAFDSPRLAGSDRQGELLAAAVFAATATDVRHVVLAGEHLVDDGVHQRVDVTKELEQSISAAWAAVR